MTYSGPMDAVLAERDKLRAEVERLRAKLAEPAQEMTAFQLVLAENEQLRAEVERLRAKADARAVEELTNLRNLIGGDANEGRSNGYNAACGNYVYLISARIAELSKPAARESEPVRCIASLGDNHCEKGRGHAGLHCCRNVEWSESTQGGEKIETWVDDWTVTLAAQAKVAYVNSAEPADELKVRLLSLVVEGLCNLGREVRRGGKS